MIHLSYSRLSSYSACPYRFYLEYVFGFRPPLNAQMSFGSSLHLALEGLYSLRKPRPSLDELFQFYLQRWLPYGYRSKEEQSRYFEEGLVILREYYRKNILQFRTAMATELRFQVELEGVNFTGIIDRVDGNQEAYTLLDYKTSRHEDYLDSLQLPLYHLALEERFGHPPDDLYYYFLREQEQAHLPAGDDKLAEALEALVRVAEGINRGRFEPKKGPRCRTCDFRKFCRIEEERLTLGIEPSE